MPRTKQQLRTRNARVSRACKDARDVIAYQHACRSFAKSAVKVMESLRDGHFAEDDPKMGDVDYVLKTFDKLSETDTYGAALFIEAREEFKNRPKRETRKIEPKRVRVKTEPQPQPETEPQPQPQPQPEPEAQPETAAIPEPRTPTFKTFKSRLESVLDFLDL